MNHFFYRDGVLKAEDVDINYIAEKVGTPFYCYAGTRIVHNYKKFSRAFDDADTMICYAVKANSNLAVLKTLFNQGAGADVVSKGELRKALQADVDPQRVVYSGVGKTTEELIYALDENILQINVESVSELRMLSEIASSRGQEIDIALRVNPDVDAGTHKKITTGLRTSKFGINIDDAVDVFKLAATLPGLRPISLALHIGSQLTELDPYEVAFNAISDLIRTLRTSGHKICRLDLGGGLGVVYDDESPPSIEAYAAMVKRTVGDLGCQIIFEPGRILVADAGLLVSKVVHVKEVDSLSVVIVDAAMNDLARPSLYDAYHKILPVYEPLPCNSFEKTDVVGPICESTDTFVRSISLPSLSSGDLLAFSMVGAYGSVMSSTYNSRLLVPEVMVHNGVFSVVRVRPDYDELFSLEKIPQWLGEMRNSE